MSVALRRLDTAAPGFEAEFRRLQHWSAQTDAAIEAGKQPENPTFPTFEDGYRALLICEKILETIVRIRNYTHCKCFQT